jgi:tagatose 6-phosphate kinase
MVAGFAAGMARGLSMVEQIRLAVAVASASALSIGTGAYLEDDLHAILPMVQIHRQ